MTLLVAGLALFLGIHLVPVVPPLRDALQGRLGANGYRGAFTIASLAGVVLIVVWLLGFVVLKKVLGGLIHIVLIIALIVIVLHFLGKG